MLRDFLLLAKSIDTLTRKDIFRKPVAKTSTLILFKKIKHHWKNSRTHSKRFIWIAHYFEKLAPLNAKPNQTKAFNFAFLSAIMTNNLPQSEFWLIIPNASLWSIYWMNYWHFSGIDIIKDYIFFLILVMISLTIDFILNHVNQLVFDLII